MTCVNHFTLLYSYFNEWAALHLAGDVVHGLLLDLLDAGVVAVLDLVVHVLFEDELHPHQPGAEHEITAHNSSDDKPDTFVMKEL